MSIFDIMSENFTFFYEKSADRDARWRADWSKVNSLTYSQITVWKWSTVSGKCYFL